MKTRTILGLSLIVAVVLLGAAGSVGANPSQDEPSGSGTGLAVMVTPLLQYQARLTDPSSGDPIADGDYGMTFRLYEVDAGGTALWSESKPVAVANGLLSTALGDTTALDSNLFHGQALWLQIEVEGEVLSPRQQIMPVAYAFSLVPGAVVAEDTSGPVLTASNTGAGEGLRGESAAGHGVYGKSTNSYGGYFDGYVGAFGSGTTYGLYGRATGTTGTNYGVYGRSGSADGYAGYFYGDARVTGDLYVSGNVGIGTTSPGEKLTVAGTLESTSGGFRFPDGTLQTTAATGAGELLGTKVLNVNCDSLGSFSTTYAKISDVGSFTQIDSSSTIEIAFNGRIAVVGSLSGTGAKFELRVDNAATTNGRARASFKSAEVGSEGVLTSITGIFTGLSSGSHTVSIWVQAANGLGTNAMVDPGCWNSDHIVIKEFR